MLSRKTMLEAALTLPPQERVDLVNDIWDSLACGCEALKLTAAQEQELDRCWQDYLADPKAGDDWCRAKADILRR